MYTYIIVDDESLTRKGTLKKISPLDNIVKCVGEASNGQEGLELIEKLNPDIIITDMHMPILNGSVFLKRIRETYPDKQIIVISGYKDFEYASHAIEAKAIGYILKPFSRDQIQAAIHDAINLIENNRSTQNKLVSMEAEKEYARYDYDIQLFKNSIISQRITELNLTSEKLTSMSKTHGFLLLMIHSTSCLDEDSINGYISSSGYEDLGVYFSHLHNRNIGFFILFFPENPPLNLNSMCKKIAYELVQLLTGADSTISIGISDEKSNLFQLNTAYNEAIEALNSKSISDKSTYSFYTKSTLQPKPLTWDKSEEFLFRIEAAEINAVIELTDNLFQSFASIPECTLYDCKYYCTDLINKIQIILNDYLNTPSLTHSSPSIENTFNSIFDFEEMQGYLRIFFSNIALSLDENSIYAIDDVIEKIGLYIKNNYQNNLSMEFISSLFYMNRSYCSSLFKKTTGQKFVDYINNIRIQQAKLLLDNSEKRMYQIAKSVGYSNSKYFFRVFKKVVGCTPEQYRKRTP